MDSTTPPDPLVRETECSCYADIRGGRYERHEARGLLKELAALVAKWDGTSPKDHNAITRKVEELEGHLGWVLGLIQYDAEWSGTSAREFKAWLEQNRPELAAWWHARKAERVKGGVK